MNLTLRLLSFFWLVLPFCAFSQINILESQSQLTGICPGQEFNVVIDASGTYNAGNRFIVQMSDSAGNFSPPRILGEIPMDGSNFTNLPLRVNLPAKNAYGDGYKIRISSTDPQVISNTVPIQFLTAKYEVTHVTCRSGSNTGRIKVMTIGGQPPVKIWVSEILQQTDIFNLPAGSYVIRMEDGNNCTLRDTITIRQLDNADQYMQFAEVTPFNLTCKDTVGNIRIVGKKLDPGVHFCFSIKNKRTGIEQSVCAPNAGDVEHLFNNIIPGEYIITLSDKTSICKIVIDPYYVGYDKTVFMKEPGVNEIGCQDTSGTIIISVDRINNVSNKLCYAYRSLNTGIISRYFCTDQTTYSFEKLPFGAYRLYVRDSVTGCMDSAVTQLQINKVGDLPEFQTDQTKTKHVSCNGGSDGAIYVDFIKGFLNKLYVNGKWYKDSLYEGGGQVWIRGLKAGEYFIHVQDGACQPVYLYGGDPVIITEPEPLESTGIFPQNPTCGKNNGSVTLALKGGTSPYRFRIQNGALQSSNEFKNLKSGIYLFEAVDANGCVFAFQPANLTAEGETVVDSVVVTPACDNLSNGSIRIYARTKEGTLQYQLYNDPPNQTGIFTNLAAATYRITVRNTDYGCDTVFPVSVVPILAPVVSQVITESPLCADKPADGRVTVKLIGGERPVAFALKPLRPFQSDSVFANLPGGIYELVIKYGNCELPPREVRLEIPIPVSLDTNVIATSCSTATIQAIASGGKGGFQYRFNNGVWDTQSEWTNLLAGNSYTIIARDANGCETQPITVTIPATGAVQIIISEAKPNTCFGRKDASYTIEAIGNGQLTLLIDGEAVKGSPSPLRFTWNNLAPGTVLVVQVVSDKSCPTAPMPVPIPGRPEIQVTYTAIGATCVPNSGSLEAKINRVGGDDRTFEYSLDNIKFQSDPLFPNLNAGKYRIFIRDVNQTDCDTFIDAEIFLQTPFRIVRPVQVKLACHDAPKGQIIVRVDGGTAPQFSLNGGAFTGNPVFEDLAKGTYTIIAKDGFCADTVQVELLTSPKLVWDSQTVTDVRCAGENNGSIALMIFGGEPPFQYSKDGGNTFQVSSTLDQLQAGVYTIVVRDANDCEITRQIEVKQLSKFSITAKVVSADCKGTKILVTPKDADGKVQYSLTENTGYGDNDTLFTTQSGNITVFAKDAVGCIQSAEVDVTSLSPITFTLEQVDTVRCFGSDEPARVRFRAKISGLAGFEVKDEKGNQVYKLDPMVHTNNVLAPSLNLKAGSYKLIITDESNCPYETTLVVPEQPQIEFIPEQTKIDSATCTASDGGIILAVKGGKGNKGFKLGINGGYQPLPQFANLKAGDHTFYVQDENGCEQETTITVPAKSPLKLGTPVVTGSCAKAPFTGKIEIKATGSTNALTYRLTATGVDESNNTGTFEKLTPNKSYTITVTDDLTQCTDELKDILVPQYPSILATITKQDESCNGADGKIIVTVTQGTAPYTYSLDNNNFLPAKEFSNLTEGTYTIYIRDANGCDTLYPNIAIAKPTPIVVTTFTKGTDVSCNGKKDGTIRIEITGGNQPYTVNITPLGERTLNSPFTLTDVSAGSYALTSVKDANGCTWTGTMPAVTITEPDAITFSFTKTDPGCEGKADGAITFQNVAGGTPPYQYSINGGTNYELTPNFTNLVAQSYRLVVKDAKGCITTTQSVTLTASAITIQTIPHLCIIRQSGSGSISLIPFAEPKGGTWSGQYVSGNEFKYDTNTPTGDYSLKYTLNGCEKTATLSVTRLILPEKDALCADAGMYTLPIAGAWTVPTGFALGTDNQTVTWNKASLPAKIYTFTYQSGNCQDAFGLELHAVPEADFVTNSSTNEFITDDPVILQATILNGADVPNATYFWKFGDGTTSNEVSPTHRYTQPNSYTIELKVTSVHNCTTTVSKTIRVDDLFRADLPNVFTPNGDDINDVFPPKGYFPPNVRVTMTILDRFGQLVYRYNSESTLPWEAKDVPAGTYFYAIEMRDNQKPDRQPVIRKGQITVIR